MTPKYKNTYQIKKVRGPIIELVWLDHCSHRRAWINYKPEEGDGALLVCCSVGYLVDETADTFVLAQSQGQPPGVPWDGMLVIAKELVIRKRVLSKSKY